MTETWVLPTAWGTCRAEWTERGLSRLRILSGEAPTSSVGEDAPPVVADLARHLSAYFDGAEVDFSAVVLDESGIGALETAIYHALRRVPRGATVTYGELAARAGSPKAAQAVGRAMARNPWPVVVPCHRVVGSDGALGGFSAPGGVATKRRLLTLEGAPLPAETPLLPGLFDAP